MAVINRISTWLDEHDPVGDITKPIFQKVEDKLEDAKESKIGSKLGFSYKGKDFHILDPYIWTADVMSELSHPELLLPTPAAGATWGARGALGLAKVLPKVTRAAKRVGRPAVSALGKTKVGKRIGKGISKGKKTTTEILAKTMTPKRKEAAQKLRKSVEMKAYSTGQKIAAAGDTINKYRPSAVLQKTPVIGKLPVIATPAMPKYLPAKSAVARAETDYLASKMTPDEGFLWDNLTGDVVGTRMNQSSTTPAQTNAMSSDIAKLQAPSGTDESIFRKALAKATAEVRPTGVSASGGSDVTGLKDEELSEIEFDRIKKLCSKFCSQMEHKAERKHKR